MRRLGGALLLGIVFLLFAHPAQACGDKLLILGRPLRFNSRPATILAYAPPGSIVDSVLNSPQWHTAMAKGRHRVRVILTSGQLIQTLTAEHFDIVLIGGTDAKELQGTLATASSPAVLIPVFETAEQDAFRNAKEEYGIALKDTAKKDDYLSAIDRAVAVYDSRAEAAARAKKNHRKNS